MSNLYIVLLLTITCAIAAYYGAGYNVLLMVAYATAIRSSLIYIATMAGRLRTCSIYEMWALAISASIILNDFFSIFRW